MRHSLSLKIRSIRGGIRVVRPFRVVPRPAVARGERLARGKRLGGDKPLPYENYISELSKLLRTYGLVKLVHTSRRPSALLCSTLVTRDRGLGEVLFDKVYGIYRCRVNLV